jgi:DNA-directed RNA polymerase specialized sigma24 family protein
MTDDQDLQRVEAKLDTVIRLLALNVAVGEGTLKERAVRLQRAGLAPKEIAELCDTTPNTVSVLLAKAKAEKRSGKKLVKKDGGNAEGKADDEE